MHVVRSAVLVGIVCVGLAAYAEKLPRAHGTWVAVRSVDKMTDAVTCYVRHTRDQFTSFDPVGRMDISFRTRGGVSTYRWRIDDLPAVPVQVAPDSNNMEFSVPDFRNEFKTARLLRVQVTTLRGQAFELEFDMRGLMQARSDALRLCGLADSGL